MNDLFRFVVLRPANRVASDDVNTLAPSFVPAGSNRAVAQREARAFADKSANAKSIAAMKYSRLAVDLVGRLRSGPAPLAQIAATVKSVTGKTPTEVAGDQKFIAETRLLGDSLTAMKLLSDSLGADGPELAAAAQGYDAIRLAAAGKDPISLRALAVVDYPKLQEKLPTPGPAPGTILPRTEPPQPVTKLPDVENAIKALGNVPTAGFRPRDLPTTPGKAAGTTPSWVMSADAVAALPKNVQDVLSSAGLDPNSMAVPRIINVLHDLKVGLQHSEAAALPMLSGKIIKVGNSFDPVTSTDYVGTPLAGLPTGHGNVRPVGVGDLLIVKEHILRYEGGELAHVENVLKSERMSRETQRLERTETTILQETETTSEQTRDTQTTDRFSLKRETSDTIKSDASLKAGLSVDASYGPTVEVKANSEFATSSSSESATKQASEFSKDVVDRSVSKLVERVLERRSVTTIVEFQEKYSHGFDNTNGTAHISGFYQWIDKVMHAQIYNYGKRLLFDVTVPEPGTNFALTLTHARDVEQTLEKPEPFTITASEINEGNYVVWAKKYDATGLEPPPPPVKTIVKVLDGVFSQDEHESSKSDVLAIDDGYQAQHASLVKDAVTNGANPSWRVFVGSAFFDAMTAQQYVGMAGEIGSVGVAYDAHHVQVMSAAIEIFCTRTERAMTAWQLKTHAAITQAYQAKTQAYEQALSQARTGAEAVIAGRNPRFNRTLMSNELRRQCVTLITGQQFDSFGALELSPEGYAQPSLSRTADQMPYVRFFEQAFEWEHLVYYFYPYFWGWKPGWKNRLVLDDSDPDFADFLRAGAARVVFPVRPGFEAAVVHYLETDEIWNGGPPPDITSPLYVPIVKEIQEATGAPGDEQPVGDPWEVRLPTTLVRLRPNDDLPAWNKVGETWQPLN
jgi:hypothetical protein